MRHWKPAAWKSANRLRQGMEARYGDYLIAWAERLRAVGARGDYLAAGNEISNPDYFNMSGDQAALVYRRLARRIRADHLSIRLAIGDNENFTTLDAITTTVNNANGIVTSVRNGKGTVGMLLNDQQTATAAQNAVGNVQQAAANG